VNIVNWNPFREFEGLFDRYSRDLPQARSSLLSAEGRWKPAASITENDNEYTIKADLPEVERKDIDVSIDQGVITITGERKIEKTSDDEKEHRRESFYGSFARSFSMPDDVDQSAITAESKNGVLTVKLPKLKVVRKEAQKVEIT
jgi:HSP20 family protein